MVSVDVRMLFFCEAKSTGYTWRKHSAYQNHPDRRSPIDEQHFMRHTREQLSAGRDEKTPALFIIDCEGRLEDENTEQLRNQFVS